MRLLMSSAALAAAFVALVAAGCGESSDTKANEAYADTVCTAIGNWADEIRSIATSFTSGAISKSSLQSSLSQAESATTTLGMQIKSASPPDTEQGQAAKQQLDQLTGDITSTVKAAESSVGTIKDDASTATITTAVAALVPQIQSLASQAQTAFSTLKDAGGDLSDAFKDTDSCKNLTSS